MAVDIYPNAGMALPLPLTIALGGTGASDAATARTNLGLGTLATLNTPLLIGAGGTGAGDAQTARTNLGLGSLSIQNANAVAITGGTALNLTQVSVANSAGDNLYGFYTNIMNAGGTNRHALLCDGDAAARFDGDVFALARLHLNGGIGLNGNYSQYLWYNKQTNDGLVIQQTAADTGGGNAVLFRNLAGTVIGSIQTSATATAYVTTSDGRFKTDIVTLPAALATVEALRPVQFRWRETGAVGQGFLAEDVATVVPDAVHGTPGAVDEAGNIVPMGMDPGKLVVWLVGAVQELAARLAAVEGATP